MAFGAELRDAGNVVQQTITDSVTRMLGTIDVVDTAQSGSVTHPGFADGVPWYYMLVSVPSAFLPPNVTITGNTLTWTHAEPNAYNRTPTGKILFGIR